MNTQENPIKPDKAQTLENQYRQYFTPPETYNKDEYFEQISLYDNSIPVHTSRNTEEKSLRSTNSNTAVTSHRWI